MKGDRATMKRTERILKGVLLCILCLSIMMGPWIARSRDVHAVIDTCYSRIEVKTDGLFRGTDIKAFLKGLKLIYPPVENVTYKFTLYVLDENGVRTKVSSGQARAAAYDLEYKIVIKKEVPDTVFDKAENIVAMLNGLEAIVDYHDDYYKGSGLSTLSTGYWEIDSGDRNKVTFDAQGGKPVPKTQWLDGGYEKVKKPTNPSKEGFKFKGWYFKDVGKNKLWDFSKPLGEIYDLNLFAVWEKLPPSTTTTTTTTRTTTTTTEEPTTIAITTERPTTPEITETDEATTPAEPTTSDDLTVPALVASEETTPSDDNKEGGKKFPLLLIIVGGLLLAWTVALFVLTVLQRRKKEEH